MLSILRIVTGLVFLTTGTMKLFGWPAGPTPTPPLPILSQVWLAGVLEVAGGAAIVLGLFTRPVAFVLAGEMAVAYFQFHFPRSFYPTVNKGQSAVLDCFIFLYLSVAGPGPISLDRLFRKRSVG
jgi:putative oxidoreductase